MKKKTAVRKAKKQEIGKRQGEARSANSRGTIKENLELANERSKTVMFNKRSEDVNQAAARTIREATERD